MKHTAPIPLGSTSQIVLPHNQPTRTRRPYCCCLRVGPIWK
ncbi:MULTISPECIES: hypothetical protein [Neisseria]|nr:hypothetical protein [Neisseria arctica]